MTVRQEHGVNGFYFVLERLYPELRPRINENVRNAFVPIFVRNIGAAPQALVPSVF